MYINEAIIFNVLNNAIEGKPLQSFLDRKMKTFTFRQQKQIRKTAQELAPQMESDEAARILYMYYLTMKRGEEIGFIIRKELVDKIPTWEQINDQIRKGSPLLPVMNHLRDELKETHELFLASLLLGKYL